MRVVKGAGGGLNHESREINEVFHDSHKFLKVFTFHVKINVGWNDYRALGMICNDHRVQGSTLVGVQGAPRNHRNLAFSGYLMSQPIPTGYIPPRTPGKFF